MDAGVKHDTLPAFPVSRYVLRNCLLIRNWLMTLPGFFRNPEGVQVKNLYGCAPLISTCADLGHVTKAKISNELSNIAIACCCYRLDSLPKMLHLPINGLIYRSPCSEPV